MNDLQENHTRPRDQSKRKFCEHCGSWMAKSLYYDHLPCEKSTSRGVKVKGESECCSNVGELLFTCKSCPSYF